MVILEDLQGNVFILNNCVAIHRTAHRKHDSNRYWIRLYTSKTEYFEVYSSVDKYEIDSIYHTIIDKLTKTPTTEIKVVTLESLINKYELLVEIFGSPKETENVE